MKYMFVNYELAKQLKNKGFDEACLAYFSFNNEFRLNCTNDEHWNTRSQYFCDYHYHGTLAPLYQQVINWFKTAHKIIIHPEYTDSVSEPVYCIKWHNGICHNEKFVNCEDKAIEEALKLIVCQE